MSGDVKQSNAVLQTKQICGACGFAKRERGSFP